MTNVNMPGRCAISGKDTYIINAVFPNSHPFAGRPHKIGNPLPCSIDVYLLLLDGKLTRVNIHEDHINELDDKIGLIWDNVLQAFEDEQITAQASVVVNAKSSGQLAQHRKNFIAHAANRPLGVYTTERTLDRGKREKAARSH